MKNIRHQLFNQILKYHHSILNFSLKKGRVKVILEELEQEEP